MIQQITNLIATELGFVYYITIHSIIPHDEGLFEVSSVALHGASIWLELDGDKVTYYGQPDDDNLEWPIADPTFPAALCAWIRKQMSLTTTSGVT